jgi:hypothetical protein
MRSRSLALVAVSAGLLVAAGPLLAHHGSAAYESTTVTLSGTVTEFRFVNPHVVVIWEVKDEAGNIQTWSGERGGPNSMARRAGWNPNTLKPGDQVTITGRPARNGTNTMVISEIILDGQDITEGGGD